MKNKKMSQGRYWIVTVSYDEGQKYGFHPETLVSLVNPVIWVYGQEEISETGYHHWQFVLCTKDKLRRSALAKCFPEGVHPHLELSRSDAADAYVRKEETKVPDSEFQFGLDYEE